MSKKEMPTISYPIQFKSTLDQLSNTIGQPDPQLLEQLDFALKFRASNNHTEQGKNTYLKDFEIPQIKLFDILANHFPLVLQSQQMAQELLLSQLENRNHLCIIDLGIGRGIQMLRLLKQLNNFPYIQKVTLIGIDIMPESIRHTEESINKNREIFTFKIDLHLITSPIENIDEAAIMALLPGNQDFTYINSSLTLHHIQESNTRNAVFKKIQKLSPDLVILIEPNAATVMSSAKESS